MSYAKAAIATAVVAGGGGVQGIPATPGLLLMGFSAAEASWTNSAFFAIYHGVDSTGVPVAYVRLLASERMNQVLPSGGIYMPNGIFIARTYGACGISLWTSVGE